ncbi:hypothetical protein LTR09_001161 [Extremus antarcticus]|uniref:C2H2-type domain-containing protein n=1 Tax=Extremus antarcticus TaxID=702011 RepID=A0AAJ0LWM1_9PEZI|nr:hypothetical protein LTR09_001161 [Extremus antarcticus]
MATFAEYQSQTMASNNDFQLYPYPDMWNQDQSFLPTSTYQDQSYPTSTSYDSYQSQQPYAQPDQFTFGTEQSFLPKHNLQPPSPNYSPTYSASHSFSFDLQPPVLSSTSDSGASIQSAISSAIGSPSAQAQASKDWSQQQSMSMLPGIVQQDSMGHDVFATTSFDLDTIPITHKGCVGEFSHISSSHLLSSVPPLDTSMFATSFDLLRDPGTFAPTTGDLMWPLQPTALPATNCERALSLVSNLAHQHSNRIESLSPNDSVFKSPTTPASATSPVLERVRGKRKASVAQSTPKRARAASPLTHAMSYTESDLPARPHAPPPTFTSPFFTQSSGNFVPPLELSYPALIQPTSYSPTQYIGTQFPDMSAHSPRNMVFNQAPSPAASQTAAQSPRLPIGKMSGSASPYMRTQSYQPYPVFNGSRRQSISSAHSPHSQASLSSEDSNKGLCPIAACGRHVKDLKAHMLTHQNERPEKCPIPTCEYHTKGFARKYDKNRHTLTHYKGTMVCGFCPGSGSAAEKSFNRADVFKRHLTSVHGVEQTPPNARRKSPSAAGAKKGYGRDVSGMCSTCGVTFASAQEFYEHLDDCVLRVVQQADPSEAINEKLLASVAEDQQVQETMEKHMLPSDVDFTASTSFNEDEEEVEEDDEDAEDDTNDTTYGARAAKSGKGALPSAKKSSGSSS